MPAMQSFVIEGGRPLTGTVRASGNKNGALPILAASVLASDEVRLSNVPRIRDVETMVELLVNVGARVEWTAPNEVSIDPTSVESVVHDILHPRPEWLEQTRHYQRREHYCGLALLPSDGKHQVPVQTKRQLRNSSDCKTLG